MNENIELFTYILHLTSYVSVIGITMPQIILSYKNLGKEIKRRFDWRTPFGYFHAVFAQAIDVFCICVNVEPVVGFMFGSCMLCIAFIEDITSEFTAMASNKSLTDNYMEMKKRFCRIIQIYSNVKELSVSCKTIYIH